MWNQFKTTCTGGKTHHIKPPNCRKIVSKCPTNVYIVFNAYYIWDFKTLSQEPFMYCFSLESVFTLTYRLLAIFSTGEIRVFWIGKVLHKQEKLHLGGFLGAPWDWLAIGVKEQAIAESIHPETWEVSVRPPRHPHRNGVRGMGQGRWHQTDTAPCSPPCPAHSSGLPSEADTATRGSRLLSPLHPSFNPAGHHSVPMTAEGGGASRGPRSGCGCGLRATPAPT